MIEFFTQFFYTFTQLRQQINSELGNYFRLLSVVLMMMMMMMMMTTTTTVTMTMAVMMMMMMMMMMMTLKTLNERS